MNVMLVVRAFILHEQEILFVQRSLDDLNNPGQWEVPGGKVDVEKQERILDALHREVREEVGIEIKMISPTIKGPVHYIELSSPRYPGALYLPLYTACTTEDTATLSDEHRNLCWLTWEDARKLPNLTKATAQMLIKMESWLR